jgi:formylglycine-generating enzyme required for sulfatase activity/tRNA A-37 threonylcarbamoyl transferase component Bud32
MSDEKNEKSLGGGKTLQGQPKPKADELETQSLGDQATFSGGRSPQGDQSLGDQMTFGVGKGDADDAVDDGMEVVDLSARYKIEKTLGKGGMGEVLLATDTRLERKVAIKRILGEAARSRTAINRFLTEAKSIAALNHPNIVQIYDYGRATDGPFLIMEFVDGESLLARTRAGALPLEEAVELTCQLCDGLSLAHDAGIIHRDIKPANILMSRLGIPKLTDFGLAKAETADTGMTMAGAVLGTLDFMPPEQRRDAALTDARSDLWSLAATLYQLVTGESPKVIRIKKVPVELQDLLDKGLEESKENRYQSAREFKQALREAAKPSKPAAPQLSADLVAGECPACHTGNEAHRKFCRECGDSLRCGCLKCQHEIPVWDKVCPECGGKQADLAAKVIDELGQKRERAEQLRNELSFDAAIALASEISQVNDRRTSKHRDWAVEFGEATAQEKVRQLESARLHFEEAQKHRAAFDYGAAIQAVEAIPRPLRSREQVAFLAKLESERSESAELVETIKARIKNRELDELLPLVERAVSLRGDREDLRKLASQLLEREQKQTRERAETFERAESLLGEGNAEEALKIVKPISPNRLTTPQKSLLTRLEQIGAAEAEFKEMILQAKADGVIDAAEIVALLSKAIKCTQLNPNNQKFLKLKDDLLARTGRVPIEMLRSMPAEAISQLPPEIGESLSPWTNSIGMQLKLLPTGTFTMGDSEFGDATPHQVTLTRPFYLGVYQVTQEQYQRVMCSNPSHFKGPQNPVEMVSWDDAVAFCKKLSAFPEEQAARRVYRLPTEAEWEYACRAGSNTEYSFSDNDFFLREYAWYDQNSGKQTHPVGGKEPNAWGLYDMHGNVWEWCADWYADDYSTGAVSDPTGPQKGSGRVYRGGSWDYGAACCRSAFRNGYNPSYRRYNYGFRVALSFRHSPSSRNGVFDFEP